MSRVVIIYLDELDRGASDVRLAPGIDPAQAAQAGALSVKFVESKCKRRRVDVSFRRAGNLIVTVLAQDHFYSDLLNLASLNQMHKCPAMTNLCCLSA